MANWTELMNSEERSKRHILSRAILLAVAEDCLTRKPRDPVKRSLMRQLGLPERYPEVQYPSPGNTPDDLSEDEI